MLQVIVRRSSHESVFDLGEWCPIIRQLDIDDSPVNRDVRHAPSPGLLPGRRCARKWIGIRRPAPLPEQNEGINTAPCCTHAARTRRGFLENGGKLRIYAECWW